MWVTALMTECAAAQTRTERGLPRVLLIGDSISMHYVPYVRELLRKEAQIFHPSETVETNCESTQKGLRRIDVWLGDERWDLIHFNFGLHDLKYVDATGAKVGVRQGRQLLSLDQYEQNLRTLVARLKQTGAKLIWCSTTPVPPGAAGRVAGDEVRYNEVAAGVMRKNGIPINDLHAFAEPRLAEIQRPANVHFTDKGSRQLAQLVADCIERELRPDSSEEPAPGASVAGTAASGVDEHTIALWLFDETSYPTTTLTDATQYRHDLRLTSAYAKWWYKHGETEARKLEPDTEPLHPRGEAGLVKGRFGNALQLPAGDDGTVGWPDRRQRYGSYSLLFERGSEVPEHLNLGYFDWTLEVWFKASGAQNGRASLFELRNEEGGQAVPMLNAIALDAGRRQFTLLSRTRTEDKRRPIHTELAIPTDTARLNDGQWHHLAFTYTADERQLRHYVDGRLQQLPEKGGFLPMIGQLAYLNIGGDRNSPPANGAPEGQLSCLLDEMRVSDVVRYTGDFTPPDSFSRNYGATPRESNKPDGPPLLFGSGQNSEGPVPLGARKHLFIDDALVDEMTNMRFVCNPPNAKKVTMFRNDKPWESTPRFGSTISDICSAWDEGDEIRMLYTNGGLWGAKPHVVCLATSKDGLNWDKPALGLYSWYGTRDTNIVLGDACQGSVIKDPNPHVPPEERYKYVAWGMYFGFYVFTSPDGIHWRRNETCALPFDPDGSVSLYWDDQTGIYRAYLRCMFDEGHRRRCGRVDIHDMFKPWPFKQAARPDMADMVLAKPCRDEVPIIETNGEVYRFKAHKYPWAPDVYLAFPWRYQAGENIRPGSFLMVSRDGEHWKGYENPYYFGSDWKLDERDVLEALIEHGMIRRGDEIWQFGTVRFTEHGGILYGGVEHDGGIHDRLLRLTQRLDGFVSLDADDAVGTVLTKPLTFSGRTLELNIWAEGGEARVALLDEVGQPVKGFDLEDCDPIHVDSVRHTVTWNGKKDVSSVAGKVVRLRFQLRGAKLFAFQFVGDDKMAR